MTDGLEQAKRLCDALGEIFCLTFVRGVDAPDALRRMGAYPDTFAERSPTEMFERQNSFDAGYPRMAGAVKVDEWAVVLEPYGFEGAITLPAATSRGTEAVAVLRHDYASPRFTYAVDGMELTTFDPTWTDPVWGAEPDRLRAHLQAVGLEPPDPDGEISWIEDAVARAVLLAAAVTGVTPSVEALTGPMLSVEIEPWFADAHPSGSALGDDSRGQDQWHAALVEAVVAATPAAKRAAAVAEMRRIADLLGVADAPGLAEALAGAEEDRFPSMPVPVPMASPLGREVRGWLRLSSTASWSLNDSDGRYRMTDAERSQGYLFGWFAKALRGALNPDPDIAVRTALHPLASGLSLVADPDAHTAALSHLRA